MSSSVLTEMERLIRVCEAAQEAKRESMIGRLTRSLEDITPEEQYVLAELPALIEALRLGYQTALAAVAFEQGHPKDAWGARLSGPRFGRRQSERVHKATDIPRERV